MQEDFPMIHLTELGPTLRSGHERVVLVTDGATGLRAFIAIHSTARGPAIGGCRIRAYPSQHAALRDALRLSGAMSRRAAFAGLPFGGGACVVMANPAMKTDAMLRALGEAVHRLGGNFIITADSGTDVLDLEVIRGVTPYARGLPMTSGEACPAAAYGTFLALQVAVSHRYGKPGLAGRRIAVQGLGKVGMRLCGYLAKAGARLVVADPNADRVAQAASEFDATGVTVRRILSVKADVLTLNAFGDVICDAVLPTLRAPVIVGAANNQLRAPRHGIALDRRGILFVPDYVANAGSLIDVAMEGPGYSPERVLRACESIWHHTARLLCEADLLGVAPSDLAERTAAERMIPVYRNTFRVVGSPKAMA
jgi:leucine dehydrogenase